MKHTIKLLTLAFTLAAILTLTGCPGPVNTVVPCTHENKKTVIETAATCTETGLEKIICADCGEVLEKQKLPIDPENHNFGEWTVTEPIHSVTECKDGKKVHTCSRCNEKEEKVIPIEHDFELTEHIIATCTECEKLVAVCKVCKTKITNEKPALGHSYIWTTTKIATKTEHGEKIHKCSRCSHIDETEVIHNFEAGGCDICGAYEHNKEDDYQISLSIYSSEEDTKPIKTLYFSFEKDSLSDYSEIEIDKVGAIWVDLSSLLQMKPNYYNCEVKKIQTNVPGWFEYEDNFCIGLTNSKDNFKIIINNQ